MRHPLLSIAAFFALGILIERFTYLPFSFLLIIAILSVICSIISIRKDLLSSASLFMSIISLGSIFYLNAQTHPLNHIKNFTPAKKEPSILKGVIVSDPAIGATDYGSQRFSCVVSASQLRLAEAWYEVSGFVSVNIFGEDIHYYYGDEVILEGALSSPKPATNPGQFDYRRYLNNKDIFTTFKVSQKNAHILVSNRANPILGMCYRIRECMRQAFKKYLSDDESALMNAMLIGDRSQIEQDLNDDFIKTGTVHILAISGLHIGIIGIILFTVFAALRMPRKVVHIFTIATFIIYAIITGANAPVVRAVIMFSIFLVGLLLEREPDILNSLGLSAFLILLFKPNQLFDAGFQLSYLSVGSIIYLIPKISPVIQHFIKNRYISQAISVSISAYLGVLPVVLYYFNIVSPIALVANIIIVPYMVVVLASGITLAIAGALFKPIAFIFANSASLITFILIKIAAIFSSVPFGYYRAPKPLPVTIALYYGLLFIIAERKMFRISKARLLIIVLILMNIFIWRGALLNKPVSCKVTFLDVGHGDSIFIEFPKKGTMLVDGGGRLGYDRGRNIIAPFLWSKGVSRIDVVVLTHPDEDHIGGLLYVINNFDVGLWVDNGMLQSAGLYKEYLNALEKRGIPRFIAQGEYTIEGFADCKIDILHPQMPLLAGTESDANNNSIVLKISHKDKSLLLCADIEEEGLAILLGKKRALKSDIIKVPHHGSALGDIGRLFFDAVGAKIAVISVDDDNRFGLPHESTLDALKESGASVYTTAERGAIDITL